MKINEEIKTFHQLHELYEADYGKINNLHFRQCVFELDNFCLIRISKDFGDFFGNSGFAVDEGAPNIIILPFANHFLDFIKEN